MVSNYNQIERRIGFLMRRFPFLRRIVKQLYQRIVFLMNKPDGPLKCNLPLYRISYMDMETFFGYYDKSPVNRKGRYMIFHASAKPTKELPDPGKKIKIVLQDFVTKETVNVFETSVYNWQQGSRAQWIDENHFIYNDFDYQSNKYFAKIINAILGRQVKIVSHPVYDVKRKTALTLNFTRLAMYRPDYGYRNQLHKGYTLPDDNSDGIFKLNINSDTCKLIISLYRLNKIANIHNYDAHKVNHILINPFEDSFVFLYRCFIKGRKIDHLFFSDMKGENIRLLANNEIVSHYCWKSSKILICYMRGPNNKEQYYAINTSDNSILPIGEGLLDKLGDGHPCVFGNNIITDTYPDKSRMKGLWIFSTEDKSLDQLGAFYESFQYYGETRCDLHPRKLEGSAFISIDSVHEGKRHMYLLDLQDF